MEKDTSNRKRAHESEESKERNDDQAANAHEEEKEKRAKMPETKTDGEQTKLSPKEEHKLAHVISSETTKYRGWMDAPGSSDEDGDYVRADALPVENLLPCFQGTPPRPGTVPPWTNKAGEPLPQIYILNAMPLTDEFPKAILKISNIDGENIYVEMKHDSSVVKVDPASKTSTADFLFCIELRKLPEGLALPKETFVTFSWWRAGERPKEDDIPSHTLRIVFDKEMIERLDPSESQSFPMQYEPTPETGSV